MKQYLFYLSSVDMISLLSHWSMDYIGAENGVLRQLIITWASADHDVWRHIVTGGHDVNETYFRQNYSNN